MKAKIISLCALTFTVAVLFSSNYSCTNTASNNNNEATCAASCHGVQTPQFSALNTSVTAMALKK